MKDIVDIAVLRGCAIAILALPLTTLPKQYNCSEGSATFMVP